MAYYSRGNDVNKGKTARQLGNAVRANEASAGSALSKRIASPSAASDWQ
jgi:hypothetical protein